MKSLANLLFALLALPSLALEWGPTEDCGNGQGAYRQGSCPPELTINATGLVGETTATASFSTDRTSGVVSNTAYCLPSTANNEDAATIIANGTSVTVDGASETISFTGLTADTSYTVRCTQVWDDRTSLVYAGGGFTTDDGIDPPDPSGRAWAYKAVPYPIDLPYDPFTMAAPTKAELWPDPDVEVVGHYYVCPDCSGATNSSNQYGTPNTPRADLPNGSGGSASPFGNSFAPGTVIMLAGDIRQDQDFGSASIDWNPRFNCAEDDFCWWLSDPSNPAKIDGFQIFLIDSEYVAFDGLDFDNAGPATNRQTALSMGRGGQGSADTKHIVIRNSTFQNFPYVGGGGGIIGVSGRGVGRETHDVFIYNNTFKNNGGGYNWNTGDNDHHGILVSSTSYRTWIIDNECVKGDFADPADGNFKCLGGNFAQTGGNQNDEFNNRLIFFAGNENLDGGMRQAMFHSKNASDLIVSSNFQDRNFEQWGGADNGACSGALYEFGYYLWIENECVEVTAGWMRTGGDPDVTGPFRAYGNLIREQDSQGSNLSNADNRCVFSFWDQHPSVGLQNNTAVNAECFFDYRAGPSSGREIVVHSNLASGLLGNERRYVEINSASGTIDFSNNIFHPGGQGYDIVHNSTYSSVAAWNAGEAEATGNFSSDPSLDGNYVPGAGTDAIDGSLECCDIRAEYITHFQGNSDFPGNSDPGQWWPDTDFNGNPRTVGAGTDIGAVERQ